MMYRGIVVIVLLLAAIMLPFIVNPFVLNVISLAFALAILATSIDLLGGTTGLVPLGQAGFMACSGYGVGIAATRFGIGFFGQIIIGMIVAVIFAMIFGLMVMRTSGIQYLMVTLALGMVIWGLTLRMYTVTGGENGLKGIERPTWLDGDISFFYFALGFLILAIMIKWLIIRSPFGLALRGLKDSDVRLKMIGYNITFVKYFSYVLAGALAGLAGIVFAYYNRLIAPDAAAFSMSGKGVLMVLLGGTGTLIGPVVGAIIVTFVENFLSGYVTRWPTVLGFLFILAVLFTRQGIVRALEENTRRIARFFSEKYGKVKEGSP